MFVCYHCGTEWRGDPKVGREEYCPKCSTPIHCCRNCRFWDRDKHNQCAEPAADWVRDKEAPNFCEYWEWRPADAADDEAARKKRIQDQIKKLFKD